MMTLRKLSQALNDVDTTMFNKRRAFTYSHMNIT